MYRQMDSVVLILGLLQCVLPGSHGNYGNRTRSFIGNMERAVHGALEARNPMEMGKRLVHLYCHLLLGAALDRAATNHTCVSQHFVERTTRKCNQRLCVRLYLGIWRDLLWAQRPPARCFVGE